ncbi:MAG: cytoskeleton protein RodZ [Solirubrobacterales bacterium]|nr:cytoskeleton protein RodZ [Solirubrobacterales bacterium]
MDSGVGTILREARNRRKVELSEVEAATRIRPRYLRAIESEEWDVLPGGVYTRGFIRTYASFLGLDGERLVGDYRENVEKWSRAAAESPEPSRPSSSGHASVRLSVAPIAALAVLAVLAVAVIAIVAIPTGGGGGEEFAPAPSGKTLPGQAPEPKPPDRSGVLVSLAASAEVWVCVLDAKGDAVVDGQILEAGAEAGPFRSGSFTVSFGNGEVSMRIDGRQAEIPATSSPIGYSIDSSGAMTQLDEAERPTCT